MKNLQELTGQESGIVIYPTDTIIICNWAREGDGIPILSPPPIDIPLNWDYGEWEVEEQKRIECIVDYILENEGDKGIYGFRVDVDNLINERTGGMLYVLNNGIRIIAPDDWN